MEILTIVVTWSVTIWIGIKCEVINENIGQLTGFNEHHCAALVLKESEKLKMPMCVTYAHVDSATLKAAQRRNFSLSEETKSKDIFKPKDISSKAELILETTRLLQQEFNLSSTHEILSTIDTRRTLIGSVCPAFLSPSLECNHLGRYRSINGVCNNLRTPQWGAANTAFLRFLPANYADGINKPRVAVDGSLLPSARVVSLLIHKQKERVDVNFTTLFMAWGQLVSHDVTFVAQTLSDRFVEELCCDAVNPHPNCFPIEAGPRDPFYSLHKRTCIEFVRSLAGLRIGCSLGARDQINQLTSYIDASFIYGSVDIAASNLRSFRGGELISNATLTTHLRFKELLPPRTDVPHQGCFNQPALFCFEAGDKRLNENILLTVLHTLWMREHNRIARKLRSMYPLWKDETIYQETRHLVAALVQKIVYDEYLPLVLGSNLMRKYNLTILEEGFFHGYDSSVNPSTTSSVLVAAFRFGHSQIANVVDMRDKHHKPIGSVKQSRIVQQPFELYTAGKVDEFTLGMVSQIGQAVDEAMSEEMTNHLFQNPAHKFGLDLAAINIQRGREHGVPGYNSWREFCGFPRAQSFDDMNDTIDRGVIERFKKIYKHPDDIDLWSAGISERHVEGGVVGPTFGCLLGKQFSNYRIGDRFWFENPGWLSSFTLDQMREIRKISLARIICDNTDHVITIQKRAMETPHPQKNPRVPCAEIPSINLEKWHEIHI